MKKKMPPPKPRPPPPTHFLCVPLVTACSRPQLAASLAAFRADVCAADLAAATPPAPPLVPEDAVRPVGTLHLTLGVFSFVGDQRRGEMKGREQLEGPVRGPGEGRGLGQGRARGMGGGGGQEQGPGKGRGEGEQEEDVGDGASRGHEVEEEKGETGEEKLARASEVLKGLRLREIWKSVQQEVGPRARLLSAQKTPSPTQAQTQQQGDADGRPPLITLRGLACMQAATPATAAVLYAPPVDELGLLQRFCERVRDAFRDARLMADEGRPLLLHATVVNTVYVKGDRGKGRGQGGEGGGGRGRARAGDRRGGGRGGGGKRWERLVFDAREVLERYEDQVWMEDVPLESVAICKMGAKKVIVDGVEDEAYEVAAEVAF
ncbi:hypothetical protein VTK26DRAFT_1416 [Humicola hyalothermophila]